jgi:uncharacterized protein (DUF952 family)
MNRPLLHIALARDWAAAQAAGEYRVSTRGLSLDDVGFIHCSADEAQAAGVVAAFYADVDEPLVVLHIDPARTGAEVRVEGGFPHLYGPLPVDAVVAVVPWPG